jgi:hypothetical protein
MNIHPRIWQPVLKDLLQKRKEERGLITASNCGSHNKNMIQSGDRNSIIIQNFYGWAGSV